MKEQTEKSHSDVEQTVQQYLATATSLTDQKLSELSKNIATKLSEVSSTAQTQSVVEQTLQQYLVATASSTDQKLNDLSKNIATKLAEVTVTSQQSVLEHQESQLSALKSELQKMRTEDQAVVS